MMRAMPFKFSLLKPVLLKSVSLSLLSASLLSMSSAQAAGPSLKDLIDDEVVAKIKEFIDTDVVRMSIENQNAKYEGLDQSGIDSLDTQWRAEHNLERQPLISATLSNPLSAYLTRIQARNYGLYTSVFVMDNNGLNVGQSDISSDYWQGDEAKFKNTYPISAKAVFIDEPEWNDDLKIWVAQVNMSVAQADGGEAIGAATIDVNLTELKRLKDNNAPL